MGDFERCFSTFCSDTDDYRPTQSSLVTRFTSTDCSDMWRTSNQDYGAFYYRSVPSSCIVDSLKAKIHRRQHRFQNWLSCQARGLSSTGNTSTIFPSTRTRTVRITHRKRFASNCDGDRPTGRPNLLSLSPCGEDGLVGVGFFVGRGNRLRADHRVHRQESAEEAAGTHSSGRVRRGGRMRSDPGHGDSHCECKKAIVRQEVHLLVDRF